MTAPILYTEIDIHLVGDEGLGPHVITGDYIFVGVSVPDWESVKVNDITYTLKERTTVETHIFQLSYTIPIVVDLTEAVAISTRGII